VDGAPEIEAVGSAVDSVMTFLDAESSVKLSGNGATRARLLAAIDAASKAARDNDVFVLMFAGHGAPATKHHPYQAWQLHGDDRFTDHDLAAMLLGLKARVTCIVISACCFGEGMFNEGPFKRVERSVLNQLHLPVGLTSPARFDAYFNLRTSNLQRVALLEIAHARRYGDSTVKPPLICLSAATYDREVILEEINDFAKTIIAAAAAKKNHHDLADVFDAVHYTGHDFHVAARPSGRMDDVVLPTATNND
jgi:hypothetical protein